MGLKGRLEALAARVEPERPPDPEVRARMRAVLDEIAAAKRDGKPLSQEAAAVCEYFRERRKHGA